MSTSKIQSTKSRYEHWVQDDDVNVMTRKKTWNEKITGYEIKKFPRNIEYEWKKDVNVIGINEFDTFDLSGGQIEFERY